MRGLVGGVEIWQSQTVGEFVAEKSNAVNLSHSVKFIVDNGRTEVQLTVYAIAIYFFSIKCTVAITTRLSPNCVDVVACEVLPVAGINDIHQVHFAVIVGIVLTKVNACLLCQCANLGDECAHFVIVASTVFLHVT